MNGRRAAAVAAAFWAVYLLTAPGVYTYDGLCYALDVEFAPASNLFHANHLLYSVVQWLAFTAARAAGYEGRALFLMQSANALAAGAAVGAFAWLAARSFGWPKALLGAALLGLSRAWWAEAADPGCYAWAGLAMVGLLALLLDADRLPPFAVGLLHGVLVLFHQMLVLVAPAFALRLPRRTAAFARYSAGLALGVGVPYALAAFAFHGGSLGEALYWALGPAGPPPGEPIMGSYWWSWNVAANAKAFWLATVDSWVARPDGAAGVPVQLAVALGLTALAAALRRARRDRSVPPLLAWIAALVLFQFFFWPGSQRYRILLLPPALWLALGQIPPRLGAGATAVAAVLNLGLAVLPRRAPGPERARTAWLRGQVGPEDFLVFEGRGDDSIMNVYLAYFAPGLPARSLSGWRLSHPDGDLRGFEERLRRTLAAGGRVFVESGIRLEGFTPGPAHEGPGGYRIAEVR